MSGDTITAGTYNYTTCTVCPDGNNGYTYTVTEVPHPIATNAQGDVSIIQSTAVVIGGPNGLNN